MKISGAEEHAKPEFSQGHVEQRHVVIDLYISTVGLYLCVVTAMGINITSFKELL